MKPIRTYASALSVIAVLAAPMMLACGAESSSDPDDERLEAENVALDQQEGCRSPRRFDARVAGEACQSVASVNGVFRVRTRSDAPQGWCSFEFRGAKPPTEADVEQLRAQTLAVRATCARTLPTVQLRPIPFFIDPQMGGAMGCDVCGIKGRAQRSWILLPPDSVAERRIEARLVSGERRAFALEGLPVGATAVVVELPAPPPNDAWAPGSVSVR
jgi:hypothetical protein